jgi:hypothetical protein
MWFRKSELGAFWLTWQQAPARVLFLEVGLTYFTPCPEVVHFPEEGGTGSAVVITWFWGWGVRLALEQPTYVVRRQVWRPSTASARMSSVLSFNHDPHELAIAFTAQALCCLTFSERPHQRSKMATETELQTSWAPDPETLPRGCRKSYWGKTPGRAKNTAR